MAEHEAAISESEAMQARRNSDSKQFKFIVRGHTGELASGSVPRQIFQAEPNSALAHIYDGEWEYAQDGEGRALVNSNPLHWPLILDWLSFGAIPEPPSKAFVSECTFWQLDKLLAAMQFQQGTESSIVEAAGKEGYQFSVSKAIKDGKYGFTLKGIFHNFVPRFLSAEGLLQKPSVLFQSLGRQWMLRVDKQGIMMHLLEGHEIEGEHMILKIGIDPSGLEWATPVKHLYTKGHRGFGYSLTDPTHQKHFHHPKHVNVDGSLNLSFTLLFQG